MAKKISQLTQATEVKSDDVTVIVQDGETKKLPLNMMVTKQDIENKKVTGLAKLDEIEATYENDTYTPTITVKNKSSVKVGEGDGVDYSANVMDGSAKSAILKGCTLVNLQQKKTQWSINNGGKNASYRSIEGFPLSKIKPSTKYLIKFNKDISSFVGSVFFVQGIKSTWTIKGDYAIVTTLDVLTTSTTAIHIYPKNDILLTEELLADVEVMLIEYQDGMENWNLPYFEGMQSVKLPVLTTTGKNLFDGELELGSYTSTGTPTNTTTNYRNKNKFIPIENEMFISVASIIHEYDGDKNFIKATSNTSVDVKKQLDTKTKYINFRTLDLSETQIMISKTGGAYEPFKSNILTVNEDVELRGIGDVKDTLDLTTGELTQRIGEVVLDGNEDWVVWSGTANTENISTFQLKNAINNSNSQIPSVCDKFGTYISASKLNSIVGEGVALNSTIVFIRIEKSKLTTENVNGFKQWLSQNPITVQYQLATESIKTVDLMPSGTHPSTTPYCWKNGHIQLSSSGLLPNLEYSVVTSRAGQINQNATMIVKNDKRIFDLEILLAGGLVNTTYQALTLQNQVETGLSKVSLNSETEPDYLLYHMIMKLIEEKAYKLDDLTEKVSVFYLYEKLSDEQFETIYSALYPFAEDEIIEEPVVEELPEVVEDEVIM